MSQTTTKRFPAGAPCSRRGAHGGVLVKMGIALVVIAGLAVGGFVLLMPTGTEKMAAAESAIQRVEHRTFDVVLTANGDLQAGEETVLRNPLEKPTAIVEIVPEGGLVKKGDVLVRLSTDSMQSELDRELLDLESARSEMVRAENALAIQESDNASRARSAGIKLDLDRLELKKWEEGDDAEVLKQLELDIDAATREVDRLTDKYNRAVELHANKFLSSDELKRDELDLIKQQSNLEKARLRKQVYDTYERQMKRTKLNSTIEESEAEIDRVTRSNASELVSKQADLLNRQRQLALRQERVKKLQDQIAAATIVAPTDGLVVYATSIRQDRWGGSDGPLKVGTQVSPNDEIIILPDNSRMVAAIKVHESLVGKVKPGQTARIKIDAVRDRLFTGTVESVGVVAEQGGWRDPNLREYAVRIAIDLGGENPGLKPSMRCEGQIVLNTVENALAAPIQSVFYEGKTSYVHVPAPGGKFTRRAVQVGTRSDSYAQILDGLDTGDAVLLRRPAPAELASDAIDSSGVAATDVAAKPEVPAAPVVAEPAASTSTQAATTESGASM